VILSGAVDRSGGPLLLLHARTAAGAHDSVRRLAISRFAPMNPIAELLPATNVLADLEVGSKNELFAAFGRLFENGSGLRGDQVVSSLHAREKLGSTGLGQGIAIPHGRIKGLREARGAFARLKTPIAFDAPDSRPVSSVFVLLVPEHATEQHLQLLSELAQMFSEKRFREALALAPDATALHELFRRWGDT
jgi:PTS system nitrogen regulatory IIA component